MFSKKRILFIFPYPSDQSPSQRFRFEQYLDVLSASGFQYTLKPFLTLSAWNILYKRGYALKKSWALITGFVKRFLLLFSIPQFDLIFIHREATPIGPPWFEWAAANVFRKKIIYDFDDAIWLPNTSEENNLVSKLKWHSKVNSICQWSYAVSCGNEYLCDYAKQFNDRVFLNPTTIDVEKLHNPILYPSRKKSSQITIGWTGTHSTLKYIHFIIPVIRSLERKFPDLIKFVVIANKNPSFDISSFHFLSWSKETEIQDLLQFDIGIMPLTDDIWAKGKCGFKSLQYMALGIPTVVSPVGVNQTIVDHAVNGFHATSQEEWLASLELLIQNNELRRKMGEAGKEKVINQYSVASNSSNFLSLFL